MKTCSKTLIVFAPALFLMWPLSADPAPQAQVILTKSLEGTFATDWQGVAGRIYFMQWSTDLLAWRYSPFLDFGDGMHSYGFESSTDQFFVRLKCIDDPEITSLDEAMEADFDGDGLSNIFEVAFGYDPYDASSTADGADSSLDMESDGMTNATEHTKALNPIVRDNPKLLLEITVD